MPPEEQASGQSIKAVVGPTESVREQDKIMLVLSYFGIFALIPLLTVKDSDFVRWHAKNGLVLGVGGSIAVAILSSVLSVVPLVGWLFGCGLWVCWMVVNLLSMVKALQGQRWRTPLVSDLAEKL